MNRTTNSPPRMTAQLMFGLVMVLIGIIFTLDTLEIANARTFLRYWPAAFILIGLAKLIDVKRTDHGTYLGGIVFIIVGAWMLLDTVDYIQVSLTDVWPLMLVVLGAVIVWQGIRGRSRRGVADPNDTVNAVAILGGVARGINSPAFKGGELTAVMGGCELDLRNASINGDAEIEVFAMWGGIEIRVPDTWTVIGKVTPLMGGFDDQTRPPQTASAHRLTVRGFVIMGGVEIKN